MYTPAEIAAHYSTAGAGKTKLSFLQMLILSVFAGAFIALGAFGSQVVSVNVPTPAIGRVLSGLIFPIGLMMVLMAGAELFTGNALIILSVLDHKATVRGLLRNWLIVYCGNFLGSVLIALLLTYSHSYSLYEEVLAQSVVNTAITKTSLSFSDAFLRGILCNILVCLAVWISFSAKEAAGKILGLYLPIVLFVVSGYEHCVANMYFIPAGLLAAHSYGIDAGSLSVSSFLLKNLLPVTLGNIIGGALFVGCGYYLSYLLPSAKNEH